MSPAAVGRPAAVRRSVRLAVRLGMWGLGMRGLGMKMKVSQELRLVRRCLGLRVMRVSNLLPVKRLISEGLRAGGTRGGGATRVSAAFQ
jgi:hypothetical protein